MNTMTFAPTVLAHVKSETREGVVHQIRMGADGNVYCTCEAWKYQRKPVTERTCKHLQAFALQANLPNAVLFRQMLATMQMMTAMVAPPAPKPAPRARKSAKAPRTNPWTTPVH